MTSAACDAGWKGYALTGRPDFLNYLYRGDVAWGQLWDFYRQELADPSSVLRLTGLFHAFLSHDFDRDGCHLDRESDLYRTLRDWADFAVETAESLPEACLRESLTGLLGQSLISPLYYEAVFNVYLDAFHGRMPKEDPEPAEEAVPAGGRRLRVLFPDLSSCMWSGAGATHLSRRYSDWNRAYVLALGDEEEDWRDDGGEG